jgi:lysozyme
MPDAPEWPQSRWHPAAKGAAWVTIAASCIGAYEGCKTVAYMDPVGIPTICFGQTADVAMGQRKTMDECKKLLLSDIYRHKAYLDAPDCVGSDVMDRLNPKVEAALVSLVYNMGPGKKGTKDGPCHLKATGAPSTMVRYIVQGDIKAACHEFPKWANPPLPGIIKRRNDEMRLCLEGAEEMDKEDVL